MADEVFPCQACGESVANPDRTRFTLSASRPAVCPRCGAPHVYEAGIQIDQEWVRRQMDELADLRRRRGGEAEAAESSRGEGDDARTRGERQRGGAQQPRGRAATRESSRDGSHDDRRDGHSIGSQH